MGKQKRSQSQSAAEHEQAIDDLADLVVENMQHAHNRDLEPFEAYASRVRARVYADIQLFRQRFHHGYHVLMDEMTKKSKHP
jgi:hypothetical protein